jgi:hypothetical protein
MDELRVSLSVKRLQAFVAIISIKPHQIFQHFSVFLSFARNSVNNMHIINFIACIWISYTSARLVGASPIDSQNGSRQWNFAEVCS